MSFLSNTIACLSQNILGVDVTHSSGNLAIRLDKPSFVAGELVTGVITFTSVLPHEAGDIVVRVRGEELLSFEELPSTTDEGPVKPIIHKKNEIFFDNTVTIQKGQGFVQPGTHTFYFQYLLPEGLPSTFAITSDHDAAPGHLYNGSVEYVIEAKMLQHSAASVQMDAMTNVSLLAGSRLVVNGKAPTELKYLRAETRKNFTLSKGSLITGLLINQGGYHPGQQDTLVMDINNTSVNAITGFDVEVVQVFSFKKLIGSAHGGNINGFTKDVVKEKKVHTLNLKEVIPPMFYGRKYIDFVVPQTLAPSSDGYSATRLSYMLKVKTFASVGFHVVELELPIYAPQLIPQNPPLQIPASKLESWRQRYQTDEEANSCPRCSKAFGLMRRRHHCRQCLQVFCSKCCSKPKSLPELGFSDSAPVCDGCFPIKPQDAPVTTLSVSTLPVYTPVQTQWAPVRQPEYSPLVPYSTTQAVAAPAASIYPPPMQQQQPMQPPQQQQQYPPQQQQYPPQQQQYPPQQQQYPPQQQQYPPQQVYPAQQVYSQQQQQAPQQPQVPQVPPQQQPQQQQSGGYIACYNCQGRGFSHESNMSHDGHDDKKCFFCESCKICKGHGKVKGDGNVSSQRIECTTCTGMGFNHNSNMEHSEKQNKKCFFCETCTRCKGKGTLPEGGGNQNEEILNIQMTLLGGMTL